MDGEKIFIKDINSCFGNNEFADYMTGEVTYRYYNEMMWPKRFANCVSVEDAIRLLNQR